MTPNQERIVAALRAYHAYTEGSSASLVFEDKRGLAGLIRRGIVRVFTSRHFDYARYYLAPQTPDFSS